MCISFSSIYKIFPSAIRWPLYHTAQGCFRPRWSALADGLVQAGNMASGHFALDLVCLGESAEWQKGSAENGKKWKHDERRYQKRCSKGRIQTRPLVMCRMRCDRGPANSPHQAPGERRGEPRDEPGHALLEMSCRRTWLYHGGRVCDSRRVRERHDAGRCPAGSHVLYGIGDYAVRLRLLRRAGGNMVSLGRLSRPFFWQSAGF